MDYTDLLRRLSLNDEQVVADVLGGAGSPGLDPILDPRALALARLAALVAVGGAVPSYGAGRCRRRCGRRLPGSSTCWWESFRSLGCRAWLRRPRNWRWRLGTTSMTPSKFCLMGDRGQPPSRPILVASCTASLREETPNLR